MGQAVCRSRQTDILIKNLKQTYSAVYAYLAVLFFLTGRGGPFWGDHLMKATCPSKGYLLVFHPSNGVCLLLEDWMRVAFILLVALWMDPLPDY